MEEKKKRYEMDLQMQNGKEWESIGGYGKLESIYDLYNYIGHIINNFDFQLTFTSLLYYNFSFPNFNDWLELAEEKNNIVCNFNSSDKKAFYRIVIVNKGEE